MKKAKRFQDKGAFRDRNSMPKLGAHTSLTLTPLSIMLVNNKISLYNILLKSCKFRLNVPEVGRPVA